MAWPTAEIGTRAGPVDGVVATGVAAAGVGEDLGFVFTYVSCFCSAFLSAMSMALERPARRAEGGEGVSFSIRNEKALDTPLISPVSTVKDSTTDDNLSS
jgi:hypothetical protein